MLQPASIRTSSAASRIIETVKSRPIRSSSVNASRVGVELNRSIRAHSRFGSTAICGFSELGMAALILPIDGHGDANGDSNSDGAIVDRPHTDVLQNRSLGFHFLGVRKSAQL